MYGALDISTSGLIAQRVRLTVASANLANARTILNSEGQYEPYRSRAVVLAAAEDANGRPAGVAVAGITLSEAELRREYEPRSPYADAQGYVEYPNVNTVVEQINSMEALGAYEANIAAAEATKSMMSTALQMLA